MLEEEAKWIGRQLAAIPAETLSPLCNVGSSTEEYRRSFQPYLEAEIFAPLRDRGVDVLHVDLQPGNGIDLVGDLCDPVFLTQLTARQFRAVVCCNLLEHVVDRSMVSNALTTMLPPGGVAIISVPNRFPYHEDPIDTMYRPSPEQIAALFPDCGLVASCIVSASRFKYDFSLLIRCCGPFYRPDRWLAAMRHAAAIRLGHYRVSCVVLQKNG